MKRMRAYIAPDDTVLNVSLEACVNGEGLRQRSIQLVVVSIGTASEDVDHPAGASITYVSKHDRDLLS